MAHSGRGTVGLSTDPVAPATLDLARHFRELRAVALPALLAAVLCAGIVFGVRSAAPAQWAATVSARAETTTASTTSSTDSTAAALLTAPYVALGTDTAALHDIITAARVPWSDAEARSRITVSDGQTPGLVTVEVMGASAEQASAVAKQAVLTLDSAARTRARESASAETTQLQADAAALNDQVQSLAVLDPKRAALQAQFQAAQDQLSQIRGSASARLAALSDPVTSTGPVSPQPARDAALALLAVLIVAAEILLAVRGRWGSTVSASWVGRTARRYGALFVDCTSGGGELGIVQAVTLILSHLRSGANVLILRSGSVADTALNGLVVATQESAGQPDGAGRLIEVSGDRPWWRGSGLERAALGVVVAHRGASERAAITRQLAALAEVGLPALLILVEQAPDADPVPAPDAPEGTAPEEAAEHEPTAELDKAEPSRTGSSGWQIVQ